MYSLNVPIPGAVSSQVWDLRSTLAGFDRLRDELTLVLKRLDARSAGEFAAVERAMRQELSGVAPFEAEIDGVDVFEDPPAGPAPVIYLAVESPRLEALHEELVDRFGAVGAIEGEAYVPHITIARGEGDIDGLEEHGIGELDGYGWTVDRLEFWDARRELPAGDVGLPA